MIIICDILSFQCPDNILKKIKVRLTRNIFPQFGTSYTACIGGCDDMFNNLMGIRANCVRRGPENNDTGYESNTSSRSNVSQSSNANRPQQRTTTARPAQQTRTTARPAQQNTNQNRNQWGGNDRSNNDYSETSWNSGAGSSSTGNQNRPTNSWNNQNSNWGAQNQSSHNNSANTNSNLGNDNEEEIMCNCHQVAKQLTVRKDGPNQGKHTLYLGMHLFRNISYFISTHLLFYLQEGRSINALNQLALTATSFCGALVQRTAAVLWSQHNVPLRTIVGIRIRTFKTIDRIPRTVGRTIRMRLTRLVTGTMEATGTMITSRSCVTVEIQLESKLGNGNNITYL